MSFDLNNFKAEDLEELIEALREMEVNVDAANGDNVGSTPRRPGGDAPTDCPPPGRARHSKRAESSRDLTITKLVV